MLLSILKQSAAIKELWPQRRLSSLARCDINVPEWQLGTASAAVGATLLILDALYRHARSGHVLTVRGDSV